MKTTLGKYTLGRTLGSGVSCKVKVAKDDKGNKVAIKILHSEPIFTELSDQECQTLKNLSHPNIVNLIEQGTASYSNPKKQGKDVDYIVLELVQGGELFDYVANTGRFEEKICRYYFKQLMEALKYMHTHGYTHRDLKPENMMLDSDFGLKVADFGFACSVQGKSGKGYCTTQLGTASYMAPEIHLGKPYNGPSVDLFASAIILFVMLTQRPPFNSANPQDSHYRLLAADRGDLFWKAHDDAEKGPSLFSKNFKDLFERMTKLNPGQRLSVDQILAHPWLAGGPIATKAEIRSAFAIRKKVVDEEAARDREKKRSDRASKENARKVKRGEAGQDFGEQMDEEEAEMWQMSEGWKEYENDVVKMTQIYTTANVANLVQDMHNWLHKQVEDSVKSTFDAVIQEGTWYADAEKGKVKFAMLDSRSPQPVQIVIQFSQVDDQVKCVEFSRKSGLQCVFLEKFKLLKEEVLSIYNDASAPEEHMAEEIDQVENEY